MPRIRYGEPMKFSTDGDLKGNAIRSYGPGRVVVNNHAHFASLILTPTRVIADWPPQELSALRSAHLFQLLELAPEIVLLGTGKRQHFPAPVIYRCLLERRIGLEIMDTGAACRTYNILLSEGRQVAAALFMIKE